MRKIFLTFALISTLAHAEYKTGNELHALLHSNKDSDWFNSIGYITGVADATREVVHCIDPNASAGQIMEMVKQYLERNPQIRHLPANYIVVHVLKQTWPCKKGNNI